MAKGLPVKRRAAQLQAQQQQPQQKPSQVQQQEQEQQPPSPTLKQARAALRGQLDWLAAWAARVGGEAAAGEDKRQEDGQHPAAAAEGKEAAQAKATAPRWSDLVEEEVEDDAADEERKEEAYNHVQEHGGKAVSGKSIIRHVTEHVGKAASDSPHVTELKEHGGKAVSGTLHVKELVEMEVSGTSITNHVTSGRR